MIIIAGPCQLESLEHATMIATHMKELCDRHGFRYVFKSSFDKANRTSLKSKRGLGLEESIKIFKHIQSLGIETLTDVHEASQCQPVSLACDWLQIPAFLCRQTDLLLAAGKTGKMINVKKGQFLAPWDMKGVVEKLESTGLPKEKIMLCERGTFFGYNSLVVDFRGLLQMREFGTQICMDATHSVQQPGGKGDSSGGNRDYAPYMAYASTIFKPDAIFMETHEDPDNAPSDGPNMIKLEDMDEVISKIARYELV
jgi:2-dehydro-3-deoxyphosphooctonate aldolase (KDO 8-P synthase)